MFGLFAPSPPKKGNPLADDLLRKFLKLPPLADLCLAAIFGAISFIFFCSKDGWFAGLLCACPAIFFALLGLIVVYNEMCDFKAVERASSLNTLYAMHAHQFEPFLMALFRLDGYQVRLVHNELHRRDDADFIATCAKSSLLVQFNHFDEASVGIKPLESLARAASVLHATQAVAVIFGSIPPDVYDYAVRKGISLMTHDDVLAMSFRLTGSKV